jgi:Ca-activated chloride channel homolog
MKIPGLNDYQFGSPWWLLLLLVIPLIHWLRGGGAASPAIVFPTLRFVRDVARPSHSSWGWMWAAISSLALASAIIAMARPQKVLTSEESKTEGIAICLCVDVSMSMLTEDFIVGGMRSNRLLAAKRVMRDFIRGRASDRIGIVAFAGSPYFPCPMTLDHEWLEQNIERVQTGITPDGTAIGSGLAVATRRLDAEKNVKSKVIVLLTDGANNSGRLSPQDSAKLAATLGIKIYSIAVGTPGQHLIPLPGGRMHNSFRQEFDEPTLQEVAHVSNGAFFKAQDLNALERIFKTIDELEKSNVLKRKHVELIERYHPFAWAAMALLALSLILRGTLLRTAPDA